MATYTSNINLKKPAQSDKIRIADFNGNADNIDAAIGADFGQGTKPSINQAINSLADGLAIFANGNVHAAITEGQFVYVRNHDTLSEGLYVASSNISANGTLSGSNLTADANGGLNAMNEKVATSYYTITNIGLIRFFGKLAIIYFQNSSGQIPSTGYQLPYTFRDEASTICQYYNGSSNVVGELKIMQNGQVFVRAPGTNVNATYVTGSIVVHLS